MSNSFYPELHVGDSVMHAMDPQASPTQWSYGKVAVTKNLSCDIVVFCRSGSLYFSDCIHVEDPRCKSGRDWAATGRGVFQLTKAELTTRKFLGTLTSLDQRLFRLETAMEQLVMQQVQQNPNSPASPRKPSPAGRP